MERFANFCKSIRNVKINILIFCFGHDKLTINTSQATTHYSQSRERNTKRIKLEALSNQQKTCESSLDVDFNTENLKTYSDEINSQCSISFSNTPLLSSTILNSNENKKETQTSNDLM